MGDVVTFDPVVLLLMGVACWLYVRAVRVLRGRGFRVGRSQQAFWWSGIALTAIGLMGPFDYYASDLMSMHMVQHLVIADISAPLILAGLRTPVLQFYLPKQVLVPLAHRHGLRSFFRRIRAPLPALAIYIFVLYTWHMGFAFEGALRHPFLHALQHESFVIASALVWWSVVEPQRRRLRGELWKIGQIIGCRVAGMFLAMAFIIASTPLYGAYYGDRAEQYGISPLTDQQVAGALMMAVDLGTMFFALCFFFYRSAQDHDIAEAREREQRAAVVSS
jgi:putative copper resistance protein D